MFHDMLSQGQAYTMSETKSHYHNLTDGWNVFLSYRFKAQSNTMTSDNQYSSTQVIGWFTTHLHSFHRVFDVVSTDADGRFEEEAPV